VISAIVCIVKSVFAAGAAPASFDPAKIVDLTYPFDTTTIWLNCLGYHDVDRLISGTMYESVDYI
jgi:hypothetical protein